MMVSIELVTMVVTVASTLVGLAAGFGWVVTRMDARFASAEQRMDARFEDHERRMDARFDRVESDVAELKTSMGDVKVAIARLEGPTPRLIVAR